MTPLTHHDLLRLARPIVARGWRIDPATTAREARRIGFLPGAADASEAALRLSLLSIDEDTVELVRALAKRVPGHAASAAAGTLSARAPLAALDALLDAFERIEHDEPDDAAPGGLLVRDLVLLPSSDEGGEAASLHLRGVEILCPPLRLRIDASTTGGTPADAWLTHVDAPPQAVRDTLASGAERPERLAAARDACAAVLDAATAGRAAEAESREPRLRALAALPDDLLAVAASRWRVLRWQGDHWKGALAQVSQERGRWLERDAAAAFAAMRSVLDAPQAWHARHAGARWRVFRRRLRPLGALLAILAVMPIAWLAVSRGGVELHPLLLGITPLLMVFMIALSAREIPVMEWPPRPRELPPETVALRGASDPPDATARHASPT